MRTIEQMISMEVHYCVSSLVSTLATAYGAGIPGEPGDLADMTEQAFELARPLDDWESAARESGIELQETEDGFRVLIKGMRHHWFNNAEDAWRNACEAEGIEPYQSEVYEHWIVSEWFADKLAAEGEKVDKDFAGMIVWARQTTGQAIYADAVIERIYAATHTAV